MRSLASRAPFALLAVGLLLGVVAPARAIIVLGPGNNSDGRNLVDNNPNDPALAGLQRYVGLLASPFNSNTTAVPIAPRYVASAFHVYGASVGLTYAIDGQTYVVDFVDRQNDLAIYQITPADSRTFAPNVIAPLYLDKDEIGKDLVTLGRGSAKGAEVTLPPVNGDLRGWTWGANDFRLSWGTNVVKDVVTGGPPNAAFGGDLVAFDFSSNGGPNEGTFGANDSGGATFVRGGDGVFRLSGINSLADSPYSTSKNGTYFNGSLFDARGFWIGGPDSNDPSIDAQFIDPNSTDPDVRFLFASNSYATRISSRLDFISRATNGTALVPEPGSLALLAIGLLAGGTVARRRATRAR